MSSLTLNVPFTVDVNYYKSNQKAYSAVQYL